MATVLCGQSFHESRLFQLGEAPVQGPRTELHACKALDVFDEAIAMLWATGQACENEDAAIRRPANAFHRHVDHPSLRLSNHDISENGVLQPAAQAEASPPAVHRVSITVRATAATTTSCAPCASAQSGKAWGTHARPPSVVCQSAPPTTAQPSAVFTKSSVLDDWELPKLTEAGVLDQLRSEEHTSE